MVLKTDQERIKALLKDTITLLCRNGLTFKTEFSIEALIGITLDQDDVLLVNINEIVRTELGNKLAAAAQESGQSANIGGDDWDDNYSDEGSQNSPSHSSSGRKRKRKRRRSKGSKAENESDGESGDSITGADDANSLSEPPMKRSLPAATSRVKNSVKQEHEDEDDDGSKDIVFIKEEVDSGDWANASSSQGQDGFPSDLSGIPSNSSMNQQQENFDFLQGNSLIPMSGSAQQNASLWSDMTGRQNITSPASKRTSTVTTTGAPGMGDESQQTLTPETLKRNAGFVEQILGSFGGKFPALSPTALYNFISPTLQLPTTPESMRYLNEQMEMYLRNDTSTLLSPKANEDGGAEDATSSGPILFPDEIKSEPPSDIVENNSSAEPMMKDDDPHSNIEHSNIEHVASNVEVQQVNEAPFPSVMERLQESQDLEQETFAGVRLPSRREFSDTSFRVNCPVCDKVFSTYQGYMRHVDQHRGRFAFHCTMCDRGFMTKDHLGNHMRGHTGEKLYCFCGIGFKSHQALRTHKKREHAENSHIEGN